MKILFALLVLVTAAYCEYCDHTSDCKLVDCNNGFDLRCYSDNVCTCVASYSKFTCIIGDQCEHAFGRCTHGDHKWHCVDSKCLCRYSGN